jgi:hypothetical protein
MKRFKGMLFCTLMLVALILMTHTISFADTDGSEIKVSDQPDKLILQLGFGWAGVEFELKTDAGVFPVPVAVDQSGILTIDLGGSKTYILSAVSSALSIPEPEPNRYGNGQNISQNPETPMHSASGVPIGHLVFFIIGLLAAAGGLFAMRYFKKRREAYDDDDDYYDDDDD